MQVLFHGLKGHCHQSMPLIEVKSILKYGFDFESEFDLVEIFILYIIIYICVTPRNHH